ncbi:MAG: peptidylprolyl isomerase [Sedimenticola sp.]
MQRKVFGKQAMKNIGTLIGLSLLLTACNANKENSIAEVGDKSISSTQFESYLKFKRLPAKDEKRRTALLDQYLEREALSAAIEKSDRLDDAMIQAELDEFRKEMLISRYFEKLLREKVTEDTVKSYYISHAEEYEKKKVRVSHMLFRTHKNMTETERKMKLTVAQEAHGKLIQGNDFAAVAKNYSEDAISAKKGGDLGWMKEGSINPKFSKTIFELEAGKVSEPFETPFGFHIVKVTDGPAVVKQSLDGVKGDIRYRLRNEVKAAEIKQLREQIKVNKEG